MNILPTLLILGGMMLILSPLIDGAKPKLESLVGTSRALRKSYHNPLESPPDEIATLLSQAEDALKQDGERRAQLKLVEGVRS